MNPVVVLVCVVRCEVLRRLFRLRLGLGPGKRCSAGTRRSSGGLRFLKGSERVVADRRGVDAVVGERHSEHLDALLL
jgi:hypothetical protein